MPAIDYFDDDSAQNLPAIDYFDDDSAQSGDIADSQESWMQTTVQGEGIFSFFWKVHSQANSDYLQFYIDGQLQANPIEGNQDWEQRSYSITGSGSHTLKWRYVKDASNSSGYDCGWVDYVQWSGVLDNPLPTDWTTVGYTYDPAGRRTSGPSLVARARDSSLECRCTGCGDCVPDVRQRDSVRPSTSNRQSSIILHPSIR